MSDTRAPRRSRTAPSLAKLRKAEAAVEALRAEAVRLRADGKALLGVTGEPAAEPTASFPEQPGSADLVRLCALMAAEGSSLVALGVLAPRVLAAMGLNSGALGLVGQLRTAVAIAAAFGLIRLLTRWPNR